jgi:hypothetical protein
MVFCRLSQVHMKILIDACPLLKSIQYVDRLTASDESSITISEFVEVLRPLNTTLEELYLEISATYYDVYMPSTRRFPNSRHCTSSIQLPGCGKVLPPNV